jgi:hypothetical protein
MKKTEKQDKRKNEREENEGNTHGKDGKKETEVKSQQELIKGQIGQIRPMSTK